MLTHHLVPLSNPVGPEMCAAKVGIELEAANFWPLFFYFDLLPVISLFQPKMRP